MTRLLLAAAAIAIASSTAQAGELPKGMLGKWCFDDSTEHQAVRLKPGQDCWDRMEVRRREVIFMESGCRFLSVRKSGVTEWQVIGRCETEKRERYIKKMGLSLTDDVLTFLADE